MAAYCGAIACPIISCLVRTHFHMQAGDQLGVQSFGVQSCLATGNESLRRRWPGHKHCMEAQLQRHIPCIQILLTDTNVGCLSQTQRIASPAQTCNTQPGTTRWRESTDPSALLMSCAKILRAERPSWTLSTMATSTLPSSCMTSLSLNSGCQAACCTMTVRGGRLCHTRQCVPRDRHRHRLQ